MIRIRKVEPEVVRELCGRLLPFDDGSTTWEPDDEFWGAFDGARLVGWGGLRQSRRWLDCVFLCSSGVLPEARGRGLQKRLIKARVRWAEKQGYYYAFTYTVPHNPASSRSLISCGFRPYWPSKPWAGDVCYWHRPLF